MPSRTSHLSLRLEVGDVVRLGPGKVRLLELIDELGSISAAGRAMEMSYRRAWLLVDSLNTAFRAPVVATRAGGKADQRAEVTEFGRRLVETYRAVEKRVALDANAAFAEFRERYRPGRDHD